MHFCTCSVTFIWQYQQSCFSTRGHWSRHHLQVARKGVSWLAYWFYYQFFCVAVSCFFSKSNIFFPELLKFNESWFLATVLSISLLKSHYIWSNWHVHKIPFILISGAKHHSIHSLLISILIILFSSLHIFLSLSLFIPPFFSFYLFAFILFLKTTFKLFFTGAYYYLDKPAPIPKFSFNEFVDPQLVDYLKATSFDGYNKAVNISTDYWFYVKGVAQGIAQNTATEAKKLWSENFPY